MKGATYLVAFKAESMETRTHILKWLRGRGAIHILSDVYLIKSHFHAGDIACEINRDKAHAGRAFDGRLIVLRLTPGTDWAHEGLSHQADALVRELRP